jgi:uncharacterized protein involved in response to NO
MALRADAAATRHQRAPYEILFPIGIVNVLAGAALWIANAFGLIPWPGPLHRMLMIEGFECAFIMGFLLTAMPAFTRGARCHPLELMLALTSAVLVDVCALAGLTAWAHGACLLGLVTVAVAGLRRIIGGREKPAEEFLFAALGLALGIAALVMLIGSEAGWWSEPQPRFGARLMSLGFVLSIVLGVGSLLVPTFSGMPRPLEIPGLAEPHQRGPRRALYVPLAILLVVAFALEAAGHDRLGSDLRAGIGVMMGLLVWKLWRLPSRASMPAYVLWSSGWLIMAGLVIAALGPAFALAGEHVVYIGGFGCVTLGVATRVATSHGGHPLALEPRVLDWPVVLGVAAALALRLAAEGDPLRAVPLLGASAAAWVLGWLIWGARVLGLIVRPASAAAPISLRRP